MPAARRKTLSLQKSNRSTMDIQAIKLELMQLLLNTQKEEVLTRLKAVFEQEREDFWDELSEEDQAAINEGLIQLDKGDYVSHQSVRKAVKDRFNF